MTRPADAALPHSRLPPAGRHAIVWLAYIAFVIYGSLVPLDFHPLPFDQAWLAFNRMPMLQIGIEGRADWIANGVLYLPVGFLTLIAFAGRKVSPSSLLSIVGAIAFCCALAVAVEFAQVFFPPRTVSRNDVIAEALGSVLGIVVALKGAKWYRELFATLHGAYDQLAGRMLEAYALGYCAFAFFPFDFVLSSAELADKLKSDSWGWFLSQQSLSRGFIVLVAKLFAETISVIPLGLLLGRWNASRHASPTRNAVVLGILLGLTIEVGQMFVFSGISQGASLLTRALGMHSGALLWRERRRLGELTVTLRRKRIVLVLGLLYLLALVAVNGWLDHAWLDFPAAASTFAQTRFLPFYYHYYTTEQAALVSLISVTLMYAPIGLIGWFRGWSSAAAFWVAALIATCIESSKLFLGGLHPDPTNVLISCVAAWAVSDLLQRLQLGNSARMAVTGSQLREATTEAAPVPATHGSRLPARASIAILVTLFLTAWVLMDFPVLRVPIATLLLCYAIVLWFHPHLLWVVIPAAIPLLDLAPRSGRFYFDEFDFIVMVSLIVGYARTRSARRRPVRDGAAAMATSLLLLAIAIGTLKGLWPLQPLDANSFSNYYSPYNALRIAKGALWAILLFALMPRFSRGGWEIPGLVARGMMVGLAGTVAIVVWERMVFPGLLDFADTYRVTGPFSQMHTGGADIETFLTAALPFAVLVLASSRNLVARLASAVVILGATYALMVTYSRAGYVGFGVALMVVSIAVWRAHAGIGIAGSPSDMNRQGPRSHAWTAPLLLGILAVAVAIPIFSASFAQERMSRLGSDFRVRQAHWHDALAMRDPGLVTTLFGMGIGRFPETHYWRSSEPKAASYRLESEAGNAFLRLGAGYPLYMEQVVAIEPREDYTVNLDIRSSQPGAAISVALCEKWLLTSARCVTQTASTTQPGQWQSYQLRFTANEFGSVARLFLPPIKFSIYNQSTATVDIDNVRLMAANGNETVANGDFSHGLDRWFFSVDQDLPWHVWSLPVAVLFDQGWLGLAAFSGLMLLALKRSAQRAWRGDLGAGAVFASLSGILVIATLDTIIDAPRFLLLLLLLSWLGTKSVSTRSPGS